jgi:hypothetical protein
MIEASSVDAGVARRNFYLWRVFRDGELSTPGSPPQDPSVGWYEPEFASSIEQVPRNRDRPASVKHLADGVHFCLTLSRKKTFRMRDGSYNWKHVHLYFTLPAGLELPSKREALDAVVQDPIVFEDAPGDHTWMRARRWRQSPRDVIVDDPPGFEAWAFEHGYQIRTAEAELAYNYVRKRSRKLWGLGSQDLYHDLLWETARLPNNRWLSLLMVTGQIPPDVEAG